MDDELMRWFMQFGFAHELTIQGTRYKNNAFYPVKQAVYPATLTIEGRGAFDPPKMLILIT
jgi:hypothetical protein